MLVLTRRVGEEILIDKQILVRVAAIQGRRVELAICAPRSVPIRRSELHEFDQRQLLSELDKRRPLSLCSPTSGSGTSPAILVEHVGRVRHAIQSRGDADEG
jgi:carbon storage regulator CsrA